MKLSTQARRRLYTAAFFIAFKISLFWSSEDQSSTHVEGIATNRSLVILMGNLRGGEAAWDTLYANVLLPNDADLALLVMDNTAYPNSSLIDMAEYVWWFPQYDDWADAMDLVNGTGWRESHLPKFIDARIHTILFGGIKGYGLEGSGMIIFMLRWFLTQHLLNDKILNKYDRFVVTRNDHFYLCQHRFNEFDLRNDTIWIPNSEDWGGCTDRHLVVGRDNILDALDIMPNLLGVPFEFNYNKHHNTEIFVKHVWTEYKKMTVKRFQRSMFTVGATNDTGWKQAVLPLHGVADTFIKYRDEYLVAKGCQNH